MEYLSSAAKNAQVTKISNPQYLCTALQGSNHCQQIQNPAQQQICYQTWERLCGGGKMNKSIE